MSHYDKFMTVNINPKIMMISVFVIFINMTLFIIQTLFYFSSIFETNLINLLYSSSKYIIEQNISKLRIMEFSLLDLILYVFKINGQHLILIGLCTICLFLIYNQKLFFNINKLISLSSLFFIILFGSLYSLSMLGLLSGGESLAGYRFLSYSIILAPIFAGIVLQKYSTTRIKKFTIFILMNILVITSIFNLFPSPLIYQANHVMMRSDLSTANYMISYKNPNMVVNIQSSNPMRLYNGLLNYAQSSTLNLQRFYSLPDHFGYDEYNSIQNSIDTDGYLYTTQKDKLIHNVIRNSIGGYVYSDYKLLHLDINVNKCYSSEVENIYYLSVNSIIN